MRRKGSANAKDKTTRLSMPVVSEEMKAWSSALAGEVADWPGATARSFFGFTALYRGEQMFGALPRTRTFGNGNLVAFKITDFTARLKSKLQQDKRIGFVDKKNARWLTFELSCDSDLHAALDWLGEAFERAAKRRKSKN